MRRISVIVALAAVMTSMTPVMAERPECDCPEEYSPVCGRNSRTYPNDCVLGCSKTLKAYDGECVRKGAFFRREPPPL